MMYNHQALVLRRVKHKHHHLTGNQKPNWSKDSILEQTELFVTNILESDWTFSNNVIEQPHMQLPSKAMIQFIKCYYTVQCFENASHLKIVCSCWPTSWSCYPYFPSLPGCVSNLETERFFKRMSRRQPLIFFPVPRASCTCLGILSLII